ncbi:hypothetical protein MBT84_40235 [Streptomyces sp. MBT84]|nr:hypothetical protein [Streptomyces sp. MBT84]
MVSVLTRKSSASRSSSGQEPELPQHRHPSAIPTAASASATLSQPFCLSTNAATRAATTKKAAEMWNAVWTARSPGPTAATVSTCRAPARTS